jgi:hypothetical protein
MHRYRTTALLALAITLLGACSTPDPTPAAPPPAPTSITLTTILPSSFLDQDADLIYPAPMPTGDGCTGLGAYLHVTTYLTVTVETTGGDILGQAALFPGIVQQSSAGPVCTWTITIMLYKPSAGPYVAEVGRFAQATFTAAQVAASNLDVTIR